jgi:hypothetical protein
MPVRLASALMVFLAVTVFSQQSGNVQRTQQWIWSRGQMTKAGGTLQPDPRVALLEAIQHDAADLSALSGSVHTDLEQLQKGMLAKDLGQKLKKMEKLSKRLRQEMAQ